MADKSITRQTGKLSIGDQSELDLLTIRLQGALRRSVDDILAIGGDLIRAKELLGHGGFGPWLDREFSLSTRTAQQFMAAARRFKGKSEIVSHLPAGALLELSAPSVPDELVDRVLRHEIPATASAIRAERAGEQRDVRSFALAGTFFDYLERFKGTDVDVAAGIAAQVLRRWSESEHREWFAGCMRRVAGMLEDNLDVKVSLFELPRTTVRRLGTR